MSNLKKITIGFMDKQTDGVTKVLPDRESFIKLAQREDVAETCLVKIPAEQKVGKSIRALKESLPIINFMAVCTENGQQPLNETAIPTGLAIHDYDHLEDADLRAFYQLNIEPYEEELDILYAGISCSGHGIRLVTIRKPGESIDNCQERVANFLHLKRDKKVKNISRGSYAVPESYIIKLDDRIFNLPEYKEVPTLNTVDTCSADKVEDPSLTASVMPALNSEATAELTVYLDCMTTDDGLPMREVVTRLMEQLCADGLAKEGNRETTIFKMATQLRPITHSDFRLTYDILAPLFKKLGLDDEEIRHAISSGISKQGGYTRNLSPMMQSITRSIRAEMGVKKEPIILPPYDLLPPLVNDILNCYPKRQHMAVLVSLMAMLGTLATGVRFKDDNRTQSLTFFAAILSQFGGGKGYIDDLEHKILPALLRQKREAIEKAEKERKERLETSNMQVRQKRGDYPSQILGDNITAAQLTDALNDLGGKHGFLCTEEISTLWGSMNSEYGKQITYIIKKGFDNGIVSKETKTDQSANVFFNCFLNLVLCGTPAMVMKFFNSTTIEDGTASRFVFVGLDPGLDGFSPKYLPLSKKQQARLDEMVEKLSNIGVGKEYQNPNGDVEKDVEYFSCQYLLNVVHNYYEEQIELYQDSGDEIFRQLANRAGVYGLRAGMLMWFLWGCPNGMNTRPGHKPSNKKMLKIGELAKWFAEYVQNQQYRYLSKSLEIINENASLLVRAPYVTIKNIDLCARFNGPFTSVDFQQLKYNVTKKYDQNPSQTLNRLADNPSMPLVKCSSGTWEYKRNLG